MAGWRSSTSSSCSSNRSSCSSDSSKGWRDGRSASSCSSKGGRDSSTESSEGGAGGSRPFLLFLRSPPSRAVAARAGVRPDALAPRPDRGSVRDKEGMSFYMCVYVWMRVRQEGGEVGLFVYACVHVCLCIRLTSIGSTRTLSHETHSHIS